ncbi:MAG: tRNA (adenosine(37)-N6)-threonylcarbamoyltransferase complex ATPase subunit type 1 TsaE [Bacteroidales bacterium]|nr:tRNA (adenosine(37)-N6)-threonylcarbamoyltransferase complex ATPase subunit type 1 TsaE [Bacteroidales bacterium]
MEIIIDSLSALPEAARKLIALPGRSRIFAFYGSMGAGKTTFIKAICEYLGAEDLVSSPTFTLVNEYRTSSGEPLFHIDFYRIRNTTELFDFGIEEYLTGEYYCFIEWPELAEEILPPGTVKVKISVEENERRRVTVTSATPFAP